MAVTIVLAAICGVLAVGWFVTIVGIQRDLQVLLLIVQELTIGQEEDEKQPLDKL